jgi:hypothetical protein
MHRNRVLTRSMLVPQIETTYPSLLCGYYGHMAKLIPQWPVNKRDRYNLCLAALLPSLRSICDNDHENTMKDTRKQMTRCTIPKQPYRTELPPK